MALRLALLLAVIFCFCSQSYGADSYLLRFKARQQPLKIETKKRVDIYETSWQYRRSHKLYNERRTHLKTVTSGVPGILQIKLEETGSKVALDGKVAPPLAGAKIQKMTISDRGEVFNSLTNKLAAKQTALTLTFPEKPVTVGDVWKNIVPATDDYPTEVTLHFKLKKVVKRHGRRCAVIETRCRNSKNFIERGCRSLLTIAGRILFDIDGGYVLRHKASSSFITTFFEQRGKLPFQISRFSKHNKMIR